MSPHSGDRKRAADEPSARPFSSCTFTAPSARPHERAPSLRDQERYAPRARSQQVSIDEQAPQCRIEGNIAQGTSSLWEEVTFDRSSVTSVDWASYPILGTSETPEAVEIVLINRPELPTYGAGEAAIRPVPAAIANAIFDATGVRLRRAPFTPERVKASLA
jgi:hypothetical protein